LQHMQREISLCFQMCFDMCLNSTLQARCTDAVMDDDADLHQDLVIEAADRGAGADEFRQSIELTLEIRAKYEKRLARCRRAWEATQDPLAFAEALTWAFHYRQPIEPWIEEAGVRLAARIRSDAQDERLREDMRHFERWEIVRDLHKQGLSWKKATAEAVKILAQLRRAVDGETVWKSYKRVNNDLRNGRAARYFYLKADARYDSQLG
jgi:hypothetical protein